MFALISPRVYIGIGVVVGIVVYLIGFAAGPDVVRFFTELQQNAIANGVAPVITDIVYGPFIFAFSQFDFWCNCRGLIVAPYNRMASPVVPIAYRQCFYSGL